MNELKYLNVIQNRLENDWGLRQVLNCFLVHTELDAEVDPAHFNLMACRIRVYVDGKRESEVE